VAAEARALYVTELEKEKTEGLEALKANTSALQELLKKGGLQVKFLNESDRVTVQQANREAVDTRY
jgi:hypothetical protein